MKARFLIVLVTISLQLSIVYGQGQFEYEIITMFADNVVVMPKGVLTANINEVTFDPVEIKSTLLNYGGETISVGFPDFNPADTIIESSRFPGLFARQTAWDRVYRIYVTSPDNRDSLNSELREFPEVFFSDKNGTVRLAFEPDDDYFPLQWGMHNETNEDADINATEAWDLTQGNPETVIGIIDVGVPQDLIEFAGRISGEGPESGDSHGTLVTGVAAAKGNNDEGVAGVTWNSQIYTKDVSGLDAVDIANSVIDAVHNGGAAVLNCSWSSGSLSSTIHRALATAHDLGVLVVAARGNQGNYTPRYPASYDEEWVLTVGSFTDEFFRSNFSAKGHGLDVLAPGGTYADGNTVHEIYSTNFGNTYRYAGGTSFAAPHVTGLVGLLDSYNGLAAYGSNFRNVIINTTTNMYGDGWDDLSGYGRVNARAALDYIDRPNTVYSPCFDNDHAPYRGNVSELQPWLFRGTRELADTHYIVKQYEVLYNAFFTDCDLIDEPFNETPIVWGIDNLTHGWSGANPNGGLRKCDVVEVGTYYVTLRTWVYEVWTVGLDYLGFYPNHWEDCTFAYTVIADATPAPPHSLTVSASPDYHPFIQWQPSPSTNVVSYSIYRMVHSVEDDWVYIANVPASTNQYEDTEYSTPHTGPIAYWLNDADYTVIAVNDYGDQSEMPPFVTIRVVVPAYPQPKPFKQSSPSVEIPDDFALYSAYPNPFNSQTIIKYALPEDSHVVIEIFNISGQKIETLISETKPAGYHEIVWNASNVASGTYLYKINTGHFSETKRMTLLK